MNMRSPLLSTCLALAGLAGCRKEGLEVKVYVPRDTVMVEMYGGHGQPWTLDYVTHRHNKTYYTPHDTVRALPSRIQITFPVNPHVGCAWGPELRATVDGRPLDVLQGHPTSHSFVDSNQRAFVICNYIVVDPST